MTNNVRKEVIRFDYEVTFDEQRRQDDDNINDGKANLEHVIFADVADNFLDCPSRRELVTEAWSAASIMDIDSGGWHLTSLNSFLKDIIDTNHSKLSYNPPPPPSEDTTP